MNGKGRAGVLVACYLMKLWECSPDYVIDYLRLIRPISIENSEQEEVIHKYHESISNRFGGYYSRIQQPSGWDNKTSHLGKDYDSLLSNAEGYDIQNSSHVSGDEFTNPKYALNA